MLTLHQWGRNCSWEDEDIQLIVGVAEQAALALSQAKLYQRLQEKQQQTRTELEVARQIQNNLLRQSLPEIKGVKVQACCYPAREVGGDFFEVFVHPKVTCGWQWVTFLARAFPAALFMASIISVLRRELSQEAPADPNVVMQNLNYTLGNDLISNNYFITLVLACYTPTTRELVYTNAGHIYPMLWSHQATLADEPNYLKVRSVPLGILPKWQAQSGRLILTPGDTLLLATDGITEATVSNNLCLTAKSVGSVEPLNRSMLNQDGLWQLLQSELSLFLLTIY